MHRKDNACAERAGKSRRDNSMLLSDKIGLLSILVDFKPMGHINKFGIASLGNTAAGRYQFLYIGLTAILDEFRPWNIQLEIASLIKYREIIVFCALNSIAHTTICSMTISLIIRSL
ncbi:hypothetical protein AVEN_164892-1 [Araneus ventricosus]|uniref:Uncharacterized protein n=1 Tax=Araneus ventricosus TaxID=182803 RepID=A0A4Y2DUF8_ARAVE|nr:hypothetical protein AVEN_164892-1 [Araneus ventricosus]